MRKVVLVAFIIIVALAAIIYLAAAARIEYMNNPLLRAEFAKKQYSSIYSFYATNNLPADNRSFLGDPKAKVTIVVVVDFSSPASAAAYTAIIPSIMQTYVDTGQAKLYHKYYLLQNEFDGQTGRFIKAAAATCFLLAGGNDTIAFHQALFNTSPEAIGALASRFNLTPAFQACLQQPPQSLAEDALETETFRITAPSLRIGVDLQDETILTGEPSTTRIDSTIRTKQITLGLP